MRCMGCQRSGIESIWWWCPDCGAMLNADRLSAPAGSESPFPVDWVVAMDFTENRPVERPDCAPNQAPV